VKAAHKNAQTWTEVNEAVLFFAADRGGDGSVCWTGFGKPAFGLCGE
jgi:hypothetical protein